VSKSWQEVQTLLDDPFVDADTKEHLLAAYIKENVDGYPYVDDDDLPDDVKQYYDQYKLRDGDFDQGSLDDVYDDAQAESDERGYSAGLTQDDIDQNTSTLDGLQAPEEGQTTGVEKSDEIFELARPALKVFENFLPVNDKVPGDSLGRYGKIKLEDVTKRYEEQLGISFAKFLDDAKRLRTAHDKLSELDTSSQAELNNLYKSWTGPAANASYQHYAEKISPNVTDLLDYLSESPGMIDTAVQNVFAECKAKADTVMSLYQPTVGSATPDIAMKVVELANSADDRDKIMEVAAWVDSVCGSNIENTIRDDDCGLNDENKEYVQRECKKWIRDSFNQDLHEYIYATFKQTCDDTLEAVDSYYEQLNQYLGEYENKFEQAGATTPPGTGTQPPGTPPGTSTTPPPSTPGGSSPGATTPSGSMPPVSTPPATPGGPGGSGPGGSGPGSMPPVSTPPSTGPGGSGPGGSGPGSTPQTPEIPDVPTPGQTTPAGTDPTGTDPTGTDPTGTGPTGTGPGGQVPGGQDPTGHGPGSHDPGDLPAGTTPGQEETVTIDDGDHHISVTSPDGQGQVKVTVDDGSGHPKTYTLDFGEGSTPGSTPDGLHGGGADGGTAGGGAHAAHPGDPQFGPQGGGDNADQPIKPGEDGKCVIHDGDLTITAERPDGSDDTVKVTVDDGSGHPATYDLDYSGDGPQATQDGNQPGHPGGQPSAAQAMYGRLNDQLDGAINDLDGQQSGEYATAGAEPAVDQGAQAPLDRDPAGEYPQPSYAATSAQASLPSDGGFFSHPDGGAGGQAGAFGSPDHGQYMASPGSHGEAGLASAGDGDPGAGHGTGQHQGEQQGSGAMAGMPMMGGVGSGAGGGDQDRSTGAQWRTTGDLFDEETDTRLRGVFGEGR
jgi:uncharacterized protein YukE